MAGHSKWANIKHKKAAVDAKKGKVFTKLTKEITVAAKAGGGDPEGNPRLRTLLEKARAVNMPIDNTTRAIKKGTGELPGVSYESITYEGYGPHGVAVIVECLTDNKNRTVADIRRIFTRSGGSLGETGAVNWMFEKMGVIEGKTSKTEDEIIELLLDFNVNEIDLFEGMFYITCDIKSLENVKKALKDVGVSVEKAEIEWVAKNKISLEDAQQKKYFEFQDELEELDDVQDIYANLE